jgi:hypothetical protein
MWRRYNLPLNLRKNLPIDQHSRDENKDGTSGARYACKNEQLPVAVPFFA